MQVKENADPGILEINNRGGLLKGWHRESRSCMHFGVGGVERDGWGVGAQMMLVGSGLTGDSENL